MMTTVKGNDVARAELLPLLTVEDLERLFRVDRRTLRRWWKQGELPEPMKLGGSNRWRLRDIQHLL